MDNPDMKTPGNSHILGILSCALCLPLVVSLEKVTIPAELKLAVLKYPVNATSCSVTCGPGYKLEEICEITPSGERRNCTLRRSYCLTSWLCGLLYFTVPVGQPFQFSCLTTDPASSGSQAYTYTWRLAQGLITTNDVLFKPFNNPNSVVKFSPTKESDAGTYRCDVQILKTLKVIKRVYFGIRVVQKNLVDLNFQKFLTWQQKLAANKELVYYPDNSTHEEVHEQRHFWRGGLFSEGLIGVGSGVLGGVLLSVALYYLQKIVARRAAKKRTAI
ncbi:PREDICTED: transmembrane protein 81 [Calidris pugnax]|uniref:transmembrane protein 81 n=1 Tax=Calidris pugnax TaxID=198806 RepID=UPI00071D325D|nr:PREDICTED: transmembrane protein 81 [Calidris pugnax]